MVNGKHRVVYFSLIVLTIWMPLFETNNEKSTKQKIFRGKVLHAKW